MLECYKITLNICFSNLLRAKKISFKAVCVCDVFVKSVAVQLLSRVQPLATPWIYICVCVCVCENHLSIYGEREREIHTHNRKMLKNLSIRKPSEY